MKCEYCNKEIPSGTEVIVNSHYFCNSLHRYYWENGQIYESSNSNISDENKSSKQNSSGNSDEDINPSNGLFNRKRPMMLGDIFSISFELIKKTFARNIVIAAVFLIPTGILLAYGIELFFTTIIGMSKHSMQTGADKFNVDEFANMFAGMSIYFSAILIFSLGYLGAIIGITKIGCSTMDETQISLGEIFQKIFSMTYLRALGQIFLLTLVVIAFVIAAILVIAITAVSNSALLKFFGGVFVFAGVLFMIYLFFRWYFILIALVHKDLGILESFSKSSFLVKGYWWRTFGIIILISIVVNFAISLITTPIYFILMWGHLSQYLKLMVGGNEAIKDPEVISNLMKSYSSMFGYVIIISTFFQTIIVPLINIVIYFDLKIRKNDLEDINRNGNNVISPEPSFE
jgi:hypothetical protein